jgi:hypothetical protein
MISIVVCLPRHARAGARAFELVGDQVRRFARGESLIHEVARYLLE